MMLEADPETLIHDGDSLSKNCFASDINGMKMQDCYALYYTTILKADVDRSKSLLDAIKARNAPLYFCNAIYHCFHTTSILFVVRVDYIHPLTTKKKQMTKFSLVCNPSKNVKSKLYHI